MKKMHDTFGAASTRADGLCVLRPAMPQGFMDGGALTRLAETVARFNLPGVRATGAQRLEVYGIPPEQVDAVAESLGDLDGACPFMVTLCLGKGPCGRGMQNTRSMAARLEDMLGQFEKFSVRPKFGISGCPRGCGQSYVRDIGLLGDGKGWTLLFGGSGGRNACSGQIVAKGLSQDTVLDAIGRILDFFAANADKRERSACFLQRIGMDAIKNVAGVGSD